jgi:hypothetical protein
MLLPDFISDDTHENRWLLVAGFFVCMLRVEIACAKPAFQNGPVGEI